MNHLVIQMSNFNFKFILMNSRLPFQHSDFHPCLYSDNNKNSLKFTEACDFKRGLQQLAIMHDGNYKTCDNHFSSLYTTNSAYFTTQSWPCTRGGPVYPDSTTARHVSSSAHDAYYFPHWKSGFLYRTDPQGFHLSVIKQSDIRAHVWLCRDCGLWY